LDRVLAGGGWGRYVQRIAGDEKSWEEGRWAGAAGAAVDRGSGEVQQQTGAG
jgi:hypothetical protein